MARACALAARRPFGSLRSQCSHDSHNGVGSVSVRDLKNRLSEHLRRVQAGHAVFVTDRGRRIAKLTPMPDEDLTLEERLAQLAEAGEIILPRGRGLRPGRAVRVRGRPVSETLLEDRG